MSDAERISIVSSDPEYRRHVLWRLDRQDEALGEIKVALVGNDFGTTGIVQRLADVEKNQQAAALIAAKRRGVELVVMTAISSGFTLFCAWVGAFFENHTGK